MNRLLSTMGIRIDSIRPLVAYHYAEISGTDIELRITGVERNE